jgi:catalytic LigB subunit of aromatic ring-opening dioxygenase
MAQIVAAFGTSHSTMQFSTVENWQSLFDHVDCRAPIYDLQGVPRPYEDVLKSTPPGAAVNISKETIARHHKEIHVAMDRLTVDIAKAKLDVMVIVGDDQREIFQDALRPAIAVYYGDTIRNAAAPATPAPNWYVEDQRKRMEEGSDRLYPCHPGLASYIIAGLMERNFDITAIKSLAGDQFEGHAYSFVHRRFMANGPIPIVPVFLNTYYAPNQPSPRRCFDLGVALRELVQSFPDNLRVGILASGGLSHFLVNEELDAKVIAALRGKDHEALKSLPTKLLNSGSSEIRNWVAVAAAAKDLALDWISYVPAYRSHAMTGVGLCFAHWR